MFKIDDPKRRKKDEPAGSNSSKDAEEMSAPTPSKPLAENPSAIELSSRQKQIVEMIETQGFVTLEGLAKVLKVSMQTVRRDVIALDKATLLQRFHGGAGRSSEGSNVRLGYGRKKAVSIDEKMRIGQKAAELVGKGDFIFLDVGTTIEAAATFLAKSRGLTIFTNSFRAAMHFNPMQHEVHVFGGIMRGADGSLVGDNVLEQIRSLRFDVCMIGCSAVEPSGAIMDHDLQKIMIKKTAISVSRRKFLLVTEAKFGRSARAQIADVRAFDEVITGT